MLLDVCSSMEGVHEKWLKHTIARAQNQGKNESKVETQQNDEKLIK